MKYIITGILVLILQIGHSQSGNDLIPNNERNDRVTVGFNVHKVGIRSPFYLGYENIRVGYWFHEYHKAGIEFGMIRTLYTSPIVGPYYRFQALDGRFHPFFEGRAKMLFTRTSAWERNRSWVFAIYGGVNLALSDRFSVEAGIGKSSIDWDQFIGANYRF